MNSGLNPPSPLYWVLRASRLSYAFSFKDLLKYPVRYSHAQAMLFRLPAQIQIPHGALLTQDSLHHCHCSLQRGKSKAPELFREAGNPDVLVTLRESCAGDSTLSGSTT